VAADREPGREALVDRDGQRDAKRRRDGCQLFEQRAERSAHHGELAEFGQRRPCQ
jgi:hypothetical protein